VTICDQVSLCVTRYLTEYAHRGYNLNDKKSNELTAYWTPKLHEAIRDYNFKISVWVINRLIDRLMGSLASDSSI